MNGYARKHHPRTYDCDNCSESELDLPRPDFEVHAIVKVIDEHEHHSEWAQFIIVAKKLNTKLYRSIDSYLNEPLWYYQLAPIGHEPAFSPFWVAENEICHSDRSDLIDTSDIF